MIALWCFISYKRSFLLEVAVGLLSFAQLKTWARRRFFLCATAPKETTPQRGPGDWPRGSSSIAICGSLIREIPSDFISGGSYMNHSSFLTSWNVLQHCGNCHRQTQAVQDVEQGGQHRYTHRLDAKHPTQWARRASGWRCQGTSVALWGVELPWGAPLGPPPWGPPPLTLGCCPRSQMKPYPAQSAVVYTSFNPQTQIDLPHHPPHGEKISNSLSIDDFDIWMFTYRDFPLPGFDLHVSSPKPSKTPSSNPFL